VTTQPVLATDGLGLDIGGASIVADVGLEVAEGEFLGIIGPNGAGKTSLFNLLSGLRLPTAGRILFRGRDVTHASPPARAQAGIARTFQLSSVFPALSAFENVRLAAEISLGGTMRIWRRAVGVSAAVERAHWALERIGLDDRSALPSALLSGGERRKLELAIVLASNADVALLDEPMAGVSAEDVPELVEVIRSVHRDERKTVLMVEHHMEVVTGLAERIAVMHHGRLLACDVPEAVMRSASVQEAYVGEPL
jgi:branched-chain amino acid transport system ATP-binding protein